MSAEPPTRTPGLTLAAAGTLLHAGQLFGLFVLYVWYVPRSKKTFDEFGLALPWLTQTVVKFSNWVCEYWWTLVPVALFLGAGSFALTVILRKSGWGAAVLWVAGVALVLLVPAAVAVYAIEFPMMKLREGLAR